MPRTTALLLALMLPALAPATAASAGLDIASEEQAHYFWQRDNRVPPPAWPAMDAGVDAACINLAYQVDAKGGTSRPILLRAWGADVPATDQGRRRLEPFAQSAALTLASWHFQPSAGRSRVRPLTTNVVFLFARHAQADLADLRSHCLVGDLRDFLEREVHLGYRRGNLNKGQMERGRESGDWEIPDGYVRHPGWID